MNDDKQTPVPLNSTGAEPLYGSSSATPQKSKKWMWISIIMGFLTVAPVAIFAIAGLWLTQQAEQGVSGTEFMILIFVPILFLVPIFVVADIVLAFIYLFRVSRGTKKRIFPIIVILLSVALLGYLSWGIFYQVSGNFNEDYINSNTLTRDEAVAKINNCEVDFIREGLERDPPELVPRTYGEKWYIQSQDLDYIDNVARNAPEICDKVESSKIHDLQYSARSVEEATTLLNGCSVGGFYYPGSSDEGEFRDIIDQTGIVLVSDGDGDPIRIHVNQSQLNGMAQVATNAKNICPELQIWKSKLLVQ